MLLVVIKIYFLFFFFCLNSQKAFEELSWEETIQGSVIRVMIVFSGHGFPHLPPLCALLSYFLFQLLRSRWPHGRDWSPILQNQGAAETSAPEWFYTSSICCCYDFLFTVTEISRLRVPFAMIRNHNQNQLWEERASLS